jgi:hypothetical protein
LITQLRKSVNITRALIVNDISTHSPVLTEYNGDQSNAHNALAASSSPCTIVEVESSILGGTFGSGRKSQVTYGTHEENKTISLLQTAMQSAGV